MKWSWTGRSSKLTKHSSSPHCMSSIKSRNDLFPSRFYQPLLCKMMFLLLPASNYFLPSYSPSNTQTYWNKQTHTNINTYIDKLTFSSLYQKLTRFLLNCKENHEPLLIFTQISVAISAPHQSVSSPSGFPVNSSFGQPQFKVSVFFVTFDSAIRIHWWLLRPCLFLSWAILFIVILSLCASFLIFFDCWLLFFVKLNFLHNLYCPINDFGFDFGRLALVPMFSCSMRRYDAWQNFFGWAVLIIFERSVGMKDGFYSCWDWDPKLAPLCILRDVPIDVVYTGIGCCFDSLVDVGKFRFGER